MLQVPFNFIDAACWFKNQCTIILQKYQLSHVFPIEKKLLDFHRYPQKHLFTCYDGTLLSQIVSPPRMRCLSSGWLQATSRRLTRPPATLRRHARVLSLPFPMEISLLIHGAAVTAALL